MADKQLDSKLESATMAGDESAGISDIQPDKELFPGVKNVDEFSQQALKSVLVATRCSNGLPTGDDFDFYSTFHSVREVLDVQGSQILQLIQRLLKQQNVKAKFSESANAVELEDKFDVLIDANDQLLERVGVCLDEAAGLRKSDAKLVVSSSVHQKNSDASWNKKKTQFSPNTFRLLSARNVQRPQFKFQDKIDNSNKPFQPKLGVKPNALLPLEDSLRIPEGVSFEDLENPDFKFPHPYQYELDHFTPTQEQLATPEVKNYKPVEETELTMVETLEDLTKMFETLKQQKEIAVDLEAHSYRTFQGITCLMQISTREQDFIIDTLALRSDICMLNDIFTDPSIVKVFHGADSDVVWLQRDFGVYIVNLFDTGQAARLLQHSRFSLSHLLQVYCNLTVDKQYQLADWRIRPLPDVLINYAREDTHYLLYIYDRMRKELIDNGNEQKNLLHAVITKSTQICRKVYTKPVFKEGDYLELYKKSKKAFNSQQLQALRNLYSWRDRTARVEDESIGYVLPNHMMLQISSILPRESQGVIACCNPIPPLVRQYLIELHNIVTEAREAPLTKVQNISAPKPSVYQHPKYDVESLLNCPHDMSHSAKNTFSLSSTPDSKLTAKIPSMFGGENHLIIVKRKPVLTVFEWNPKFQKNGVFTTNASEKALQILKSFSSPFEKYLPPEALSSADSQENKKQSSDQMDEKRKPSWRLKAHTKPKRIKRKEEEDKIDPTTGQPQHLFLPPVKKQKVDTVTNPVITKEEEMTQVSLRQQIPSKKKKKKRRDDLYDAEDPYKPSSLEKSVLGNDDMTHADREKEKEEDRKAPKETKKKRNKQTGEDFKPFDYSKADKSVFEASKSNTSDVFDPNTKHRKKKNDKSRKVKNPYFRDSRRQKSMTFS